MNKWQRAFAGTFLARFRQAEPQLRRLWVQVSNDGKGAFPASDRCGHSGKNTAPGFTSGGQRTGCANRGLRVWTTGESTLSAGLGGPLRRIPRRAVWVYLGRYRGDLSPSNGHDLRQLRSSWSSRAQASTSSNSAGELLAMSVITFWRQARFTWHGRQAAYPSA